MAAISLTNVGRESGRHSGLSVRSNETHGLHQIVWGRARQLRDDINPLPSGANFYLLRRLTTTRGERFAPSVARLSAKGAGTAHGCCQRQHQKIFQSQRKGTERVNRCLYEGPETPQNSVPPPPIICRVSSRSTCSLRSNRQLPTRPSHCTGHPQK